MKVGAHLGHDKILIDSCKQRKELALVVCCEEKYPAQLVNGTSLNVPNKHYKLCEKENHHIV